MKTIKQIVEEMKDKELLETYKQLDDSINVTECFGTKDALMYELIAIEIQKRGLDIPQKCWKE